MKFWFLLAISLLPYYLHAQIITRVAGDGSTVFSGDGGPAITAGIPNPAGNGAFDRYWNYYFADGNDNRIRKISTDGIITTVAGTGDATYSGDGGLATSASLYHPGAVIIDTAGNLIICDGGNNRIRKVDVVSGIISTIVGTGTGGYCGDNGPATAAMIWNPQDICLDTFGNLYIADLYNYVIRKVAATGIITTFAGTGTEGYPVDGVQATAQDLNFPVGLVADDTGNIYIADVGSFSSSVRKVNLVGNISTVAGNGSPTYSGDMIAATEAQISPWRLEINNLNELFISDRYNQRIYKVDEEGIIHSIAGNGIAGSTGDGGPATAAELDYPNGVCLDPCGNLYIPETGSIASDDSGHHIRKVTFNVTDSATIVITGVVTAATGSTVTLTAALTDTGSSGYSIQWYNDGVLLATTTTPTVSYTKTAGTDTITAIVIPVAGCNYPGTAAAHIVSSGSVGVIDAASANNLINIYPNPATSSILISSNGGIGSVTVLDLMGREVAAAHPAAKQRQLALNIAALLAGVYIVKVDGAYVSKMVKE